MFLDIFNNAGVSFNTIFDETIFALPLLRPLKNIPRNKQATRAAALLVAAGCYLYQFPALLAQAVKEVYYYLVIVGYVSKVDAYHAVEVLQVFFHRLPLIIGR